MKNAELLAGAMPFATENACVATKEHDIEDEFEPPGLREVYGFYEDILHMRSFREGKALVFCTGHHPKNITVNALLVGAFMILNDGMSLEQVVHAFEPLADRLVGFDDELAVEDCWRALHHVNANCGWLKLDAKHRMRIFRQDNDEEAEPDTIDMEEYVHYDNPLNGNLHVLVPEKLLVFDRPADLPDGQLWADAGGERRFSAAYYAEVLCDFDVAVVLRACDEDAAAADGHGYDAGAFAARGIEVEEVGLDADGGVPTMAEIDRFLAVARHAPGAVAVHGGAGGLGAAGTLIAAHLISAHRFRAKDAVAWVRMIHPAALPPAHRRFLGDVEAHVRRRHLSMPSLADACGAAAGDEEAGGDFGLEALAGLAAGLPRSVSAPRIFDFLDAEAAAAAAAAGFSEEAFDGNICGPADAAAEGDAAVGHADRGTEGRRGAAAAAAGAPEEGLPAGPLL